MLVENQETRTKKNGWEGEHLEIFGNGIGVTTRNGEDCEGNGCGEDEQDATPFGLWDCDEDAE